MDNQIDLIKLRQEILDQAAVAAKPKKVLSWSSKVVTGLLVVLVLVAVVQLVEASAVLAKIQSGNLTSATSLAPTAASSSASGGVNSLPDMVGGC